LQGQQGLQRAVAGFLQTGGRQPILCRCYCGAGRIGASEAARAVTTCAARTTRLPVMCAANSSAGFGGGMMCPLHDVHCGKVVQIEPDRLLRDVDGPGNALLNPVKEPGLVCC